MRPSDPNGACQTQGIGGHVCFSSWRDEDSHNLPQQSLRATSSSRNGCKDTRLKANRCCISRPMRSAAPAALLSNSIPSAAGLAP
jgi:hypothetical protein